MPSALEVWEFDPSCDLAEVARLASARLAPPSFTGRTVSLRGEVLTLQVLAGSPTGDARSLFHVAGLGAFAMVRREVWPPAADGAAERILLTLRASPRAGSTATPP